MRMTGGRGGHTYLPESEHSRGLFFSDCFSNQWQWAVIIEDCDRSSTYSWHERNDYDSIFLDEIHHSTLQSDVFLLTHSMPCFSESATSIIFAHLTFG